MASPCVAAVPNLEPDFHMQPLSDSVLNGSSTRPHSSLPRAHRSLVQPRRKASSVRSSNIVYNNPHPHSHPSLSPPPSTHVRNSLTRRRRTGVRARPPYTKSEYLDEAAVEKESQISNWSPGNCLDSCASTASPYNSQDESTMTAPPPPHAHFNLPTDGVEFIMIHQEPPPHALLLRRFLEKSNTDGIIPEHTRKQLLSSLDFGPTPKKDVDLAVGGHGGPEQQSLWLPYQGHKQPSIFSSSETTFTSVSKNTSPPPPPSSSEDSFFGSDDFFSFIAPPQQQERLLLIKRLAEAGLPYRPRPVPSLPPLRVPQQHGQVFIDPNLLDFNVINRRDRAPSTEMQPTTRNQYPATTSTEGGLARTNDAPCEAALKLMTTAAVSSTTTTLSPDELPSAPNILGRPIRARVLDLYEPPLTTLHDLEAPKETNKLSHLILTWTTSPAYHVEVAGTFTEPPWTQRHELYWCKESRCHWIDLHEICPRLCGIQQFKFIVDGIWKCDPSYPICDDGSSFHHLNNVMVIFPHRLRVRLSHQRLLRRHSLSNSYNNAAAAATDPTNAIRKNTSRALQRRSPQPQPQLLRTETLDTQNSHGAAVKPVADSLFDIFAEGEADSSLRAPSPDIRSISASPRLAVDISQESPSPPFSSSPLSNEQSVEQMDRNDQQSVDGGVPNSSLLRIPSWACRTLLDCSCVSAHTTPAALSKSNSRALLESRWRQAADSATLLPLTADEGRGGESCRRRASLTNSSVAGYSITRQVTSPVEGNYSLETSSSSPQGSMWPREHRRLLTPRMPKPPVISGCGTADSQTCRPLMISNCRQDLSPSAVREYGDKSPGEGRYDNDKKSKRHRKKRRCHESRGLKGNSQFDGPLIRCLSHHGGRQMESKSPLDGTGTILTDWPSWVTEHLHSPEVLLELLLPSNVMKMQAENLQLFPGWSMTPHPEKASSGGADAFYISSDYCCLALADGVGEWDDLGFSPRSFADELMQGVKSVWERKSHPLHKMIGRLRPSVVARELMKLACNNPTSYGSATCCIVVFDPTRQQLGICNLGDSGVSIMRRGKKYQMVEEFKTPELCHFFNCPYQVSHSPPPQVLAKVFGMTHLENGKGFVLPSEDLPKHAQCFDFTVEEGDLLVLASDGLWDNLWDFEIQGLCNLALAPFEALILHDENLETTADEVARAVLEAASYRSRDVKARTPFAKSYTTECGIPAFTGGKWDDITVIAAWVGRKASSVFSRRTETSPPCFQSVATEESSDKSTPSKIEKSCLIRRSIVSMGSKYSRGGVNKSSTSKLFDDIDLAPVRFPYSALSEGHSDDVDTDSEFMKELDTVRNSLGGHDSDDTMSRVSSSPKSTMRRSAPHPRGRRTLLDQLSSTSNPPVKFTRATKTYVTPKRGESMQHGRQSTASADDVKRGQAEVAVKRSEYHRRRHLKRTKEQLAALYPAGAKYGEC